MSDVSDRELKNEKIIKSIAELGDFADFFIKNLSKIEKGQNGDLNSIQPNGAAIVCLSGDLGAGKTTFSQQVAKILNIHEVVNSPTFVIQKNYTIGQGVVSLVGGSGVSQFPYKNFIHIDAYRLEDAGEMEKLKFFEIIADPENLIFIEWPERIAKILPKQAIFLKFESVDENSRKIFY